VTDLDIAGVIPPIHVVFNASIGELNVALLVARQIVLTRPAPDLFDVTIGPSIAILVVAIPFLQELLVLPLQLVVQASLTADEIAWVEACASGEAP
jgi:hypothetical protein